MTQPPPNARSTEKTTRPREPFCLSKKMGEGFIAGSVLGSAYHLPKGGLQAVCTKVPRVSAYFAVFLGAHSAIEYAMVSARQKEEPVLNAAVAAAGASGIAAMLPWGLGIAAGSALFGFAFGGASTAGMQKFQEVRRRKLSQQHADDPAPAACPTSPVEFPGTPPGVA